MKTYLRKFKASAFRNKKIATAIISAIMVLSVLAILSFGMPSAYGASGSFTLNPTVFSHSATSTIVLANGGTFASGATVKFYASTTTTFSSSNTVVGTYSLPAGVTTLSNAAVTFNPSLIAAGNWYIAASDDSGSTFTSSIAITVTSINPKITLSSTSTTPGSTETVTGSGFDSGSTVSLYLSYATGTTLVSTVSASSLNSGVTFTVPDNVPGSSTGVTYYVVAQESSTSSTNYGITTDASFSLTPSVTVSPISISGAASSTFTVTGHGFPASDSFSASTTSSPVTTIQFAGVDAINPSFSSDSTGTFSVTATGLSAAIALSTYNGLQQITIHDSASNTFSNVDPIIVSQTNPSLLGFSFAVTATTGSTYNVNDAFVATVWDFPSSQSVSFWLGPNEVGSLTTDSNGAGQLTSVIPPVAGATYTPEAVDNATSITTSPTSGTSSYAISAFFRAIDPNGAALIVPGSNPTSYGEYVPSSGLITIQAYGLTPTTSNYDFYDSEVASGGIGAAGLVTSVKVGTESSSTGKFTPAANGTLIFIYSPDYAALSSPPSTGTTGTISSANSVSGYDSNSYAYYAIGSATVSTPGSFSIILAGATGQGFSFSGLIPYTASLYPGISNQYNVYVGSTELTLSFTNHFSVVTSGSVFDTGDTSFSFTAPGSLGLYNLNITYNGESVATSSVATQHIVISSAGTSPSAGTLVVSALSTAGNYEVVGYGYEATSSLNLYYTVYGTSATSHRTTISTSNGAFVSQISPGSEPAGTYSVFTLITSAGTNYFVYSTYTVSDNLTLGSYHGNVGSSVTVTAKGLVSTAYYNLYLGSTLVTSNTGSYFAGGSNSFTVPTVPKGSYTVSIEPLGSSTAVETAGYLVKANSAIALGTSSQYAFPGQLVQFTVGSLTAPSIAAGTYTVVSTTYTVSVALNSSLFTTVPTNFSSSSKLSGSFLMPNDASGSYFEVTFTANKTEVLYDSSTHDYYTVTQPFTGTEFDFLGLVSGNGAYILGISQAQIAEIEGAVNSTMTVSLNQLDAAISSINGDVATITTQFGTMSTTLNTINASLTSINSGVATLETTLGQIKTSLASLNATVVALNGDTATISTAVGVFNTTINNINATVTLSNGNIATIKTDLGTFTGNVTSVSNGIATIQTKLGTIQTNTNQVVPSYGTSFLLEVIILILAVLAVAFSALAMVNSKKSHFRRE
ncbi:MAG: hypothetical protein M1526_04025 [Candidatus Thermoplasmatota archaeon]|nr:hypothetical protein [Candidatus Thermoplasmatota archaeon]